MTFNWRHSALILADCLLAVYLFMAVTAFNRPDETADVCTAMNIHIEDGQVRGFLDTNDVKAMLLKDRLYPLGDPMSKVDVRRIEELIASNPFVKSVECYKTHSGTVHLNISQRLPVIRVKSDGGDDYYVDDQGNVMPQTRFVSNMVVATGHIQRPYAQKVLTALGRYCYLEGVTGEDAVYIIAESNLHFMHVGLQVFKVSLDYHAAFGNDSDVIAVTLHLTKVVR